MPQNTAEKFNRSVTPRQRDLERFNALENAAEVVYPVRVWSLMTWPEVHHNVHGSKLSSESCGYAEGYDYVV